MELFSILIPFIVILAWIFLVRERGHPNYPCGPTGLPLLGNVLQMGRRPYLAFRKWKVEYGNVFSVKLGLDDAVVINDPKLVKELFSESEANGRIQSPIFQTLTGTDCGVAFAEGEAWQEERSFLCRKLRELGFAKSSMEGMILEEAKGVLDYFSQNSGIPIAGKRVFNGPVANSIWSIVSSENSDEVKAEILKHSEAFMEAIQQAQRTGLLFLPFLKYIIPEMSGWRSLVKATTDLRKLCDDAISQHQATLDVNCPRDLVDCYLIEIANTKDPNSRFFKEKGLKSLKSIILELFVSGNETTGGTLSWTLLYLSCHPEVQQKLIDEVGSVLGRSSLPSLADRAKLPYTEAVIMETLRMSALVMIGMPHRLLEDKMFQGYFLPKHTLLIADIDLALHDKEYWGDPENFRPERFLSEDGSKIVPNDALIPFGVGKRQCLGENFANDMLFLFTASIFKRFRVLPDPDISEPDLEPEAGFGNLTKPFRIVMKELD